MGSNNTLQVELSRHLEAELECAQALLVTLEHEYDVLTGSDSEEIEQATARKQQQMIEMTALLAHRDHFLKQQGLAPGKAGTEELIGRASENSVVVGNWQTLQKVASKLRRRNETNGGIIAMGQRHVQQALNIVTGHTGESNTYGREGNQQARRSPQTLAKA